MPNAGWGDCYAVVWIRKAANFEQTFRALQPLTSNHVVLPQDPAGDSCSKPPNQLVHLSTPRDHRTHISLEQYPGQLNGEAVRDFKRITKIPIESTRGLLGNTYYVIKFILIDVRACNKIGLYHKIHRKRSNRFQWCVLLVLFVSRCLVALVPCIEVFARETLHESRSAEHQQTYFTFSTSCMTPSWLWSLILFSTYIAEQI